MSKNGWAAALRLTGIGFYVVTCILLGVFGGLWLDNKLVTGPLFIILGLVIGLLLAGYGVYRMIIPLIDKPDSEKEQ